MLLELIELGILLTFACSYVSRALTFDLEGGDLGLWSTPDYEVKWQVGNEEYQRPVSFFDRVRRLFGAYQVEGKLWFVNPLRMAVWSCPVCLSFWVSLALTIPTLLVFGYPVWLAPLMVFAVAGAASR